ncbi:HAD family hydrolase [Pelagicoccus sp. SDUM812003]|uniref:HAD family hydrolase n=1 Tax=Pelagicoccus sp. SDUM812003 TaxID=3041267 RepID=UPI0028109ADC|nr:HAD family hydrolase [Pelagicoccus sp. SDUM812003]MDQ8205553.1 HAD family hydrolase [Pelagicoccus sp. SDUM812003]
MLPDAKEIKGLLFDMDGTLIDHLATLTRCFQLACSELGYPEPSLDRVKRTIGGSMPITIQKFLPPEKVEDGKRIWTDAFERFHLEGVVVLPGAERLLNLCRQTGRKTGVFTNKTGRHTRAILENENLLGLVDFALGAEDTPYRKPQPEYSQAVIETIALPAPQVAMVGDSPFDIQAAQAVGMRSLCVTTGSHTRQELQEAGADQVFETMEQIADWLES